MKQAETENNLGTLKEQKGDDTITSTTSTVERYVFSTSFSQKRLWFLDQYDHGSSRYNFCVALQLEGELNIQALKQSLDIIVARHESLRTSFEISDGQPVQVVSSKLELPLPVIPLTHLNGRQQKEETRRLLQDESRFLFDLSKGPLIRSRLICLTEQKYVLVLNLHHIVCDGWSMDIIYHELSICYQALCSRLSPVLTSLPIQFVDFAIWQRDWLQDGTLEQDIQYWRGQLDGLSTLELPTDRPRPPVLSYEGDSIPVAFSESLSNRIMDLCQQTGVTLFMFLIATFQVLLHRYSGQHDIAVGTPVSGRNRIEVEGLIGFFVNTLVLRCDLSGGPSFRKLLSLVRNVALDAYAHQDTPFEKLVEELQPERNLGFNPLFQTMFVLQNRNEREASLPGLVTKSLEIEESTANFDLTLTLGETRNGLKGSLNFNTGLFDRSTIERMAGHLQILLGSIVSEPDCKLSALPLLSSGERSQLLNEWNKTPSEFPEKSTIHQLFEIQAALTPENEAVVWNEDTISYQELNRRANQLARHLKKHGTATETLTGICMERSLDMLVAVLGVLKAGGAYLPLDPTYPEARLAFMLTDSRCQFVLTQESLRRILPDGKAVLICPDSDREIISREDGNNLDEYTAVEQLAYVIYTSGSSGQPKGVMIEHRNVTTLVSSVRNIFTDEDLSGMLASTSLSFDVSVFEIFAPLLCGGRIILAENILHTPELPALHAVRDINTVPSAIAELVDSGGIPPHVRTISLVGEPLSASLVNRLFEKTAVSRVIDLYGPTESTVYATCCLRNSGGMTTIGRPIPNYQAYILDVHQQPVPVGVPGELYLGGSGLARGYLNRPELTARKFIPHPFSDTPGARLYKTGDRARYFPDGNIEFLGRVDNQVKIRGFRIEPGEIESALEKFSAVKQAVVQPRKDIHGSMRLVAYILTEQGPEADINDLRAFLKNTLPEYMVPSTFVSLDALPLTSNNKIDYMSLPEPDISQNQSEEQYIAPRNALEMQLMEIWQKILGVHPIGIHHDFFDLGGHSLLCIQLLTQIEHECGKRIPLTTFFQGPTISQLSLAMHQEDPQQKASLLIPVQPLGSKRPFFFAAGGGGSEVELVLGYGRLTHHLGTDQPFYGLSVYGKEANESMQIQIREISGKLIEEIRTIQPEGPYLLGGQCVGGIIAFEIAQQLKAKGDEVALLVLIETARPTSKVFRQYQTRSAQKAFRRVWNNQRVLLQRMLYHFKNIPKLASEKRLQYLLDKGRKVKKLRIENKEKQEGKQARRDYQKTLLRYTPDIYPGRITLLVAEDEQHSSQFLGWEDLAMEGIEVHKIPGNHVTHMKQHYLATAEKLKDCLDSVQTGS